MPRAKPKREILCAGLACLALLGQMRGADAQQVPPLRVTTRLVQVHVIAQDKQGELVQDLTRQDFVLLDEGREQPLSTFNVESHTPSSPCLETLAPNTFSNRMERCLDDLGGATVILFDALNTRLTDQAYARQQIIKFLEHLQPQDRVALYALGQGPLILQDFASSPGLLLRALTEYKGGLAASLDTFVAGDAETGIGQFNTWMDELQKNLYEYAGQDRALRTIRVLAAIANHVERIPGRKNLIWVSGSFPVGFERNSVPTLEKIAGDRALFDSEFDRAVRALDQARLAIYPLDARGLMAPRQYGADRASIGLDPSGTDSATFLDMQMLAKRTGGRAFFNDNDLVGALRRAADDSRLVYVLGYYPTHNEWSGKFRRIRIQVKRPDVRLWYRQGYFAQPQEPAGTWYGQSVLNSAIWSPLSATGLGMTVRVLGTRAGALDLELLIDPQDIAFQAQNDVMEGKLDVKLAQLGRDDRLLGTTSHVASLRLTRAQYEQAVERKAVILPEHLEEVAGVTLLRVMARDFRSNALGSVSVPLNRPPAPPRP
ncbi:MAG: VWA domain-containing protein [Acidobacteriia bacterium]|nr:VWA domain-containing protein [Terriglobia bacterium]